MSGFDPIKYANDLLEQDIFDSHFARLWVRDFVSTEKDVGESIQINKTLSVPTQRQGENPQPDAEANSTRQVQNAGLK